jgi:hypothetical protein
MKTKIFAMFFISIFLLSCNSASVIPLKTLANHDEDNIKEKSALWAVFITFGEPQRDEKNTRDLYDILINQGWKKDNIYFLQEEDATKEAILTTPIWLNNHGADEDDLILYFFSMHGGRTEDIPPLDEPDDMDEFIVPYKEEKLDVYDNIFDEELASAFESIKSEKLILIFETCYSGGMIDGVNDLRKSDRIILTSSSEKESSYPVFLKKSWLFPYYLIKGLTGPADANSNGIISVEESFKYAEEFTIKRSTIYAYLLFIFHRSLFIQYPQIYDGWPSEENNEEELEWIKVS